MPSRVSGVRERRRGELRGPKRESQRESERFGGRQQRERDQTSEPPARAGEM
jgi:hypothetical protein